MNLQTIVSRRLSPNDVGVVSVTELITDGTRNALPGLARILGDARSFRPEISDEIEKQMRVIAEGTGRTYDVAVEVNYTREFVPLLNDPLAYLDEPSLVTTENATITIVYDGLCHLCSGSTAWIARRVEGRVRFVPVQSDEGAEALKAVGLNALDPESFLVVRDGQCLQKSTAVIAALNVVGGGWKMAALLLGLLPYAIAERIYDWIAANRYRWFGKRTTCFIPRSHGEVREE